MISAVLAWLLHAVPIHPIMIFDWQEMHSEVGSDILRKKFGGGFGSSSRAKTIGKFDPTPNYYTALSVCHALQVTLSDAVFGQGVYTLPGAYSLSPERHFHARRRVTKIGWDAAGEMIPTQTSYGLHRWRLASIFPLSLNFPTIFSFDLNNGIKRYVSSQLSLRSVPSDRVSLIGEANRNQNQNAAETADIQPNLCPPSAISGCIRRFPLGAQIGVSLILGGSAILCVILGAMRPFGLLVIGRSDIVKAISYGFLSVSLFAAGLWVWMLGG